MAENQNNAPQSKRAMFGERMKKRYPDREFADDEALFGQINDDYDEYDNQIGQYRDREEKLTDLFAKDPKSAQFITDMAKGNDPWIAVLERLGIDGVTDIMNDPSKKEAYAEANKKYVERLAKEKSLEEEYNKNFAESTAMLEQLQNERQLPDETIDAAWDMLQQMANDMVLGKVTRESMEMALKAITRDADVENARTEGVVAGRNEQIDERLRKPQQGDGMPNLGGSNNAPKRKEGSLFDLARDAQ